MKTVELKLISDSSSLSAQFKVECVDSSSLPHSETLDMQWITDRILLVGKPWNHVTDIAHRHNNAEELSMFLEDQFFDRYLMFYLDETDSSEFSFSQGSTKEEFHRLFHHQVIYFKQEGATPWTLSSLLELCESLNSWIDLDESHIAVIHGTTKAAIRCLSGIACFLKYTNSFDYVLDAWNYVCQRKGQEISLPVNLKRTMHYFDEMIVMRGKLAYSGNIRLHKVIIHLSGKASNNFQRPCLKIYQRGVLIHTSRGDRNDEEFSSSNIVIEDDLVLFRIEETVSEDVEIRFYDIPRTDKKLKRAVWMCKFIFHSGFMPAGFVRILHHHLEQRRDQWIERIKDIGKEAKEEEEEETSNYIEEQRREEGLDKCYTIDLIMSHLDFEDVETKSGYTNGKRMEESYESRLLNLNKWGIEGLVKRHVVKADPFLLSALEQQGWQRISAIYALQRKFNSIHDAHEYLITHTGTIKKIDYLFNHQEIGTGKFPITDVDSILASRDSGQHSTVDPDLLHASSQITRNFGEISLSMTGSIPPPPTLPGGVPMPPPLPFSKQNPQSPITSTKRLKSHLQWKEIQIDPHRKTIWTELLDDSKGSGPLGLNQHYPSSLLDEAKLLSKSDLWIDVKLFEDMFVVDSTSGSKAQIASTGPSQSSPGINLKPKLIDLHRANTILISLSRFHKRCTTSQLFEKIDRLDVTNFTSDDIMPLIACLPTEDETKTIGQIVDSSASQNAITPGTAESFISEFLQQPTNFKHAVKTFVFRLKVFDELDRVRRLIEKIDRELRRLRDSDLVRLFLKTVLKVAQLSTVEYSPSPRRSMKGFRLEALLRLKDVKSKDGRSSLMHYIAHLLNQQYPEVLQLPVEFESLSQLQNLNSREWKQSLMKLKHECEDLKNTSNLSLDQASIRETDKIRHEFLIQADQSIDKVIHLWENMFGEWKKTAEFFGEDANQSMESFFNIFHQSLTSLDWAHKENQKSENMRIHSTKSLSDDLSSVKSQSPALSSTSETLSNDAPSDWKCQRCHKYLLDCNCSSQSDEIT